MRKGKIYCPVNGLIVLIINMENAVLKILMKNVMMLVNQITPVIMKNVKHMSRRS